MDSKEMDSIVPVSNIIIYNENQNSNMIMPPFFLRAKVTNKTSFLNSYFPPLDVDECITGHNCNSNANCTNTIGSYNCSCNDGFEGNGFNCSGE